MEIVKRLKGRPTHPNLSVPDPNEARRRMLFLSISGLAIPALFLFAAVMFARGHWAHGLLDLGVGLAVTVGAIGLKRFRKIQPILRSITALIGLLLVFDMAKGGSYGEMILWMYTWPLLVFFAHGKKEGLLWMIPMLLLIHWILWWPPTILPTFPYPQPVKIRFLVSYVILTALAYYFEATRQVFQDGLMSERARIAEANAHLKETNRQLKSEMEQRHKLEMDLKRASKMEAVGALAGGVAHDLNNILSGLVSYPDLVLLDLPENSPLRQPLMTMQASGKKAAAIVQDLLTLARRGLAVTETLDLNRVVDEYLRSPECAALKGRHPNVTLRAELSADLLPVAGSPVHLSKAVMNLVTNAAEAMPDGGEIRIVTANRCIETLQKGYESLPPGEYAVLKVVDSGTGISEGDRERIFEPFYTKKKMGRSGTGLGMSIVWATVKDHEGFVDLASADGRGTTVRLYFPITRQPYKITSPKPQAVHLTGRGEIVLVVDDIEEQRQIASAILERLGYRVATAASGEEAIGKIAAESYDLLLLDMIMDPGMDGLDTYLRILETCPRLPAVLASGYSKNERVRQALKRGASAYLRKPYTLNTLEHAVRKALTGAQRMAGGTGGALSSPTA
jgi:signal transduction histidine kinase/CheY-like chemotaxis protein